MRMRAVLSGIAAAAVLGVVPAGSQPATSGGYLKADQLPNSLTLLPPPPAKGSAAEKRDVEASKAGLKLHGGPRWDLATQDAVLTFPAAAGTFSCALGVAITEADTPATYRILRRTLTDLGRAPYPTKNLYKRARPFMANSKPQCTPQIDAALRGDGSYPSGHATIGWGWALILAELAPNHADAILTRGRVFTDSRRVCNVHWLSDTEEARTLAGGVVAKLHADPAFQDDLAKARLEIDAARARGLAPSRDCALEAGQMAAGK